VLAVHCALGEGQAALVEDVVGLEVLVLEPSPVPTTVPLVVELEVLVLKPSPVPITVPLVVELCVGLELEEVEDVKEEGLADVSDELELPLSIREVTVVVIV
jgi:hypothetical protein